MEAVRRASRGRMGTADPQDSLDSIDQPNSDEDEPLLIRRARSEETPRDRLAGQRQFREARQEAAQQAAMSSGWFTWTLICLTFCLFGFWFYVNIWSWYILFQYYEAPCDQPLAQWLLVKLLLDILSSSTQRQQGGDAPSPSTWLILGFQNVWLVLGFNWCSECRTCLATSPELFNWVQFLVVFGTVVTIFLMLLPVLFYVGVVLVVHLIGTGRIKNNSAARADTLELLEKVEYSTDLFANSADANDSRPAGDCCCCCDDFNAEKVIVRTPCEHYFHEDCLGEWLKLAKTCPICRLDLEFATEEKSLSAEKVAAAGADIEAGSSGVLEDVPTSSSGGRASVLGRSSLSSSSGTRHNDFDF